MSYRGKTKTETDLALKTFMERQKKKTDYGKVDWGSDIPVRRGYRPTRCPECGGRYVPILVEPVRGKSYCRTAYQCQKCKHTETFFG